MISLGKAVCRKNFGRIFFKSFLDLLKSFPVGSKSLFCFFCFLFVTKILQCAQYCVRQALALREAGDCRGVRAASLCGVRGLRVVHMYMYMLLLLLCMSLA